MGRVSFALMLTGAGIATWQAGREWDDEELAAKKLVSPLPHVVVTRRSAVLTMHQTREEATQGRWERMRARFTGVFDVCCSYLIYTAASEGHIPDLH